MKKLLLTTFAALLCVTVQAETLAVFKQTVTVTKTGGGRIVKTRYAGYQIINDIGVVILYTDAVRKKFSVEAPDFEGIIATGSLAKTHESYELLSGVFRAMAMKGIDKPNALYAGTWNSIPSSMAISGTDRFFDPTEEAYIWEYRGSAIFDRLNSTAAVKENLTVEQVIQRLKNGLIAKGYSEE